MYLRSFIWSAPAERSATALWLPWSGGCTVPPDPNRRRSAGSESGVALRSATALQMALAMTNDLRDIKPPVEISSGWEWLWVGVAALVFASIVFLAWKLWR